MPRTSYALKAAGLSIAVMLVAALPGTSPAASATEGAATNALFALGSEHDPAGGASHITLRLLDGMLRPRGSKPLSEVPTDPRIVVSPDRTRAALVEFATGGARVRLLRLPDLATVRDATLDSYVDAVVWPRSSTIVVVASRRVDAAFRTSLVELDPVTLRTRSSRDVSGAVASLGGLRGRAFAVTDDLAGGVRVLAEARPGRWVERRLPLARVLEPWRTKPGAHLPPRAHQSVVMARAAAAAQAGASAAEVQVRAVEISGHNFCEGTIDPFADALAGYRVYLDVGGEHLVYAYGLDPSRGRGRRVVRCWNGVPRREPLAHVRNPTRDLLSVPNGTWAATALSVAPDARRRRLAIASGGAPTFEVDLAAIRYGRRRPAATAAAWKPTAFSYPGAVVNGRTAAFTTGTRVVLADRATGKPRAAVPGAAVGVADGRLLVEAPDFATYVGVDASGRRRYRIRVPVGGVNGDWRPVIACGTRAYVPRSGRTAETVSVLDVARGRRVTRRVLPPGSTLLPSCG